MPIASTAAAPHRPIAWAAASAAAGAASATVAPHAPAASLVLVACAIASVGWILGWTAAGGGALERSRYATWVLAACIALGVHARAAALADAAARAPPGVGMWRERDASEGRVRGTLGARRDLRFELDAGSVRHGEWVRVLDGAASSLSARGPVEPPAAALREVQPKLDEVVRLAPPTRAPLPWQRGRAALLAACDRLPDEARAAFARALVCGDDSRLERDVVDLFTRTGTRHLLAVSGQHVALISLILLAPLARILAAALRAPLPSRFAARIDASYLCVALVVIYAPLAGGGSPVRRAALAAGLALCARAFAFERNRPWPRLGRRADAWSLWSLALLLECIVHPLAIGELSLQLSYAATAGLIALTGPIARAFDRWSSPREPTLRRGWFSIVGDRARAAARLALAASFAAVIATLPLSWRAFGELSAIGAIATVIALPIFALLLALAWFAVLWQQPSLVAIFGVVVDALTGCLAWLDRVPATPLPLPERPMYVLVVATTLAWIAIRQPGVGWRRSACIAWAAVLAPWACAPRAVELHALDVGHGTAVLLRAPGEPVWIFDAGSRDRTRVAQAALAPLLRRWDAFDVALITSHADRDHAGAVGWLGERFRPAVWAGALGSSGRRSIDLTDGELLLPTRGAVELRLIRASGAPGNEGSRSLIVGSGGERALLCGDAEEDGLARLLRGGRLEGPFRIVLMPHHGAAGVHLGAFLNATRPEQVWISASGPSACEAELARRGIDARTTWRDGPLALELGGPPSRHVIR